KMAAYAQMCSSDNAPGGNRDATAHHRWTPEASLRVLRGFWIALVPAPLSSNGRIRHQPFNLIFRGVSVAAMHTVRQRRGGARPTLTIVKYL
ncbi:hypothetical protein, partial [Mycobacterium tuberculosis]